MVPRPHQRGEWSFRIRIFLFGVIVFISLVQVKNLVLPYIPFPPSLRGENAVHSLAATSTSPDSNDQSVRLNQNTVYFLNELFTDHPDLLNESEPIPKLPAPKPKPLPFYQKYVPVPKGVSPNSVRLYRSQAPLPVSAKRVNGRWVCDKKKNDPDKSDQNKRAHIDRQCCLDPDEVPNPHCSY